MLSCKADKFATKVLSKILKFVKMASEISYGNIIK